MRLFQFVENRGATLLCPALVEHNTQKALMEHTQPMQRTDGRQQQDSKHTITNGDGRSARQLVGKRVSLYENGR